MSERVRRPRAVVLLALAGVLVPATALARQQLPVVPQQSSPRSRPTHYGVQGGFDFSTVTFSSQFKLPHSGRFGATAGVFITNDVRKPFFLQADAMFTSRGTRVAYPSGTAVYGFRYLDLTMLLGWFHKAYRGPSFHVFAGPSVAIKLSETFSVAGQAQQGAELAEGHDFGFTLGAGWDIRKGYDICVRARLGGSNILRSEVVGNQVKGQNRTIQVTFGMEWPR